MTPSRHPHPAPVRHAYSVSHVVFLLTIPAAPRGFTFPSAPLAGSQAFAAQLARNPSGCAAVVYFVRRRCRACEARLVCVTKQQPSEQA